MQQGQAERINLVQEEQLVYAKRRIIELETSESPEYELMEGIILIIHICEASLQNPQNVAQNERVVISDVNLISLKARYWS